MTTEPSFESVVWSRLHSDGHVLGKPDCCREITVFAFEKHYQGKGFDVIRPLPTNNGRPAGLGGADASARLSFLAGPT